MSHWDYQQGAKSSNQGDYHSSKSTLRRDHEINQHHGHGYRGTNLSTNSNYQDESYHHHGDRGTKSTTHSYPPGSHEINHHHGAKSLTHSHRRDKGLRKEYNCLMTSSNNGHRHGYHHGINSATHSNPHGSQELSHHHHHGLKSSAHNSHEDHIFITRDGSGSQQSHGDTQQSRQSQHSQHGQYSQHGQHGQYSQHGQHSQYGQYNQYGQYTQYVQHSQHGQYSQHGQHSSQIKRVVQAKDDQRYHKVPQQSQHIQQIQLGQYSQCSTAVKRATQARDDQSYLKVPHGVQNQSWHSQQSQHSQCSATITRAEQARDDQRYLRVPHGVPKQSKINGKTFEQYLPYPAEGVLAVYTTDPVRAEAWLRNHVIDVSASAVGLDIEWKPQFKKKKDGGVENKTAVLQLAVEQFCLVLHLCHMDTFPKSLATVLANKAILKVGSGILQDAVKLRKDRRLSCEGRADTQVLAKACGVHTGGIGLKSLSKTLLNIELSKPKRVTMSNWEQFPLAMQQIHYAALDAWIGLKIFLHLKEMLKEIEGRSTVPCDLGEPKELEIIICEVCGKKCKGNKALDKHVKESSHTKCGNCGKLFQTHVPKKHKKKCIA